jgi:hypothetical protein
MVRISGSWLAFGTLAGCLFAASPCLAEQPAGYGDQQPALHEALLKAIRGEARVSGHKHQIDLDWGTGALSFNAAHVKEGRRFNVDPGSEQLWQRGAKASAELRMDVAGGWSAALSGNASLIKRGAAGGPLFTRRNSSRSAELGLSLVKDDNTRFTFSAFDRGGWTPGSLDEFSRRIASGDQRRKSGLAFEIATSPARQLPDLTFGLRGETATTPGLGHENSLSLSTHLKF